MYIRIDVYVYVYVQYLYRLWVIPPQLPKLNKALIIDAIGLCVKCLAVLVPLPVVFSLLALLGGEQTVEESGSAKAPRETQG